MKTLKIEIKNRWTGKVLFEHSKDDNTIKETILEAIKGGINLKDADLRYANLVGADLRYANLRRANLGGADLRGVNLEGADLKDADLRYANLEGADLRYANLEGADLRYANLVGANLGNANLKDADLRYANLVGANLGKTNLRDADLRDANLRYANLMFFKTDFWEILLKSKFEIGGLKQFLKDGKVDGSTYSGECACLVGTIANVKGCDYEQLEGIVPNSDRPAEQWFAMIKPDHTPENSQVCRITMEWIEEFEHFLNK